MNKPSRFPHSLVLIFAMVVLAQLLTYVLPKGKFETEPRPSTGSPFVESDEQGTLPLRERLAKARAERGLSEEALAALFHVSPKTVRAWEAGPVGPEEQWRIGAQIEANVGALLDRWVRDGTAPTDDEIEAWKAAVADGHPTVVGDTYETIEGGGGLPWHTTLTAIPRGFVGRADIIFFVFVVGGVIGILRATGAIDALIGEAIQGFSTKPVLLIAGMTLLFAIGSSTIGMAEEYMPFVPILVTLCLALKMDAVVALGIVYIGAGVGYGCAALNPFTVAIAQDIAGVEPTSGWLFRVVFMIVACAVGVLHIVRYANRIKRDPSRSLVRDIDYSKGYEMPEDVTLTPSRIGVLLLFCSAIVLFVYGVAKWDWYFHELMAVFLGLGIASAIVARLNPNLVANRFCEGAAEMTTTALLIGVASTIEVVLSDGQVIDTIIQGIASAISGAGPFLASIGMLIVQSVANLFIPSGSGQAYVTMPIMAPLAELCDVSPQTAVLAYQVGDGFMNMVVPTNALLMGMLALGRVPYGRWLKFILPLMIQLYLLAAGAMLIARLVNF
ncbi:MAG: TIGR00366 family protein [Planctomycetes bacterium]|nr:TIGR00366 family protein [Planctomycetota bacterium]